MAKPTHAKPKTFKQQHKKRRRNTFAVQSALGILILALLFGISHVSIQILHGQPAFRFAASIGEAESTSGPGSAPEPKPENEPESTPESKPESTPQPESKPEPQPESTPPQPESTPDAEPAPSAPQPEAWNTAQQLQPASQEVTAEARMLAVPENGRLSEEYLKTVMFVGDSLSQGFAIYEPTRGVSTVCAYKGTGPKQVVENFVGERYDRTRIEMWDEIKTQAPGTIYVLFGTNALVGQSDEAFLKYYGDLLDMLRARYSNVPIYVQSITPTTAEQGVKQPPLENGHIRQVNNIIAKMAVEKGMYYLDAQEVLADAEGNLRGDFVGKADGIHMNPTGYAAWADYILTHTVYSASNSQFAVDGSYS